MTTGNTRLRIGVALAGLLTAILLAACGGGSGAASTLLRQTFSGPHKVQSGVLSFNLTLRPQGSSTASGPLSLSFGGPFESRGAGQLPKSNFNLDLSALGRSVALGILSTGTAGYVTFEGASYALPSSEFQKLEASFSSLTSSPGSSSGSGILAKLGIQPLHWLKNPTVVGEETVGGAQTTHIRAAIDVAALLRDFSTFLQRASSLGISGAATFPRGLSQSTINRISSEIQNPSFDVWTGKSDKTIRRLQVRLTAPVHGALSALFGGSLGIELSMQYSNLNQPQTITAPAAIAPFTQFEGKLRQLVAGIQSGVAGLGAGGASSSSGGSSGSGSSSSGSSSTLGKYTACIQAAGNNVAKMQQCASILNGH